MRDLSSTNGTWVNGHRIEHSAVAPRSVIRIGDHVGLVVEQENAGEFGELAPRLYGGAQLANVLSPLRRAARSSLTIQLVGATGTGKERFAYAAHHFSRRTGPYVTVNCAALPEHLAEAELFGYRRGAFTGADRASPGHFRTAAGGTLFLDEVPELSLATQAKLLRIIEDGQVQGLGEAKPTRVDVRIISASQTPLSVLVAKGQMRDDLAARLSGLEVLVPPLVERQSDIVPLFAHFASELSGGQLPAVDARLVEALCLHHWPRNVRELELVTRRLLVVHGHEPTLRRVHLPSEFKTETCPAAGTPSPSPVVPRAEYELRALHAELAVNGGNISAAAMTLKLSRQRIYRLLRSARQDVGPNAKQA